VCAVAHARCVGLPDPVQHGHADVHEHDVRPHAAGSGDRASPSPASPTTLVSGSASRILRSPTRASARSSAIRTVVIGSAAARERRSRRSGVARRLDGRRRAQRARASRPGHAPRSTVAPALRGHRRRSRARANRHRSGRGRKPATHRCHERRQVVECRLRCKRLSGLAAQHPDQAAHLRQRAAADPLDRLQYLMGRSSSGRRSTSSGSMFPQSPLSSRRCSSAARSGSGAAKASGRPLCCWCCSRSRAPPRRG
jgi:hypothetical protein